MICDKCGTEMVSRRENYLYKESGLSNITLADIEVRRCPKCGEQEVIIPRMADLHRALADVLVANAGPRNGAELRFLRKHMGFSGAKFAEAIGYEPETVSRWENDKMPIPAVVRVAVQGMVKTGIQAGAYEPIDESPPAVHVIAALDKTWRTRLAT